MSAPNQQRSGSTNTRPLDSYENFHQLAMGLRLTIQPARYDKWRICYPNAGMLDGFEHLGTVLILCTDGTEAYFHVGRDTIFHGHLRAFNGPVASCYVWEDDWDYVARKRRVRVFKRKNGTLVIIPRDKEMEEYRAIHDCTPIGKSPEDEGYVPRTADVGEPKARRSVISQKKLELLNAI